MDPLQLKLQYDKLAYRQLIIAEGIQDLEAIQRDFQNDSYMSKVWGNVAVFAHIGLLVGNIIINAFEAKAAVTLYQVAVKSLYSQFGKSGSHTSGNAKKVISLVFDTIINELRARGLKEYIPGINILAGFALDALALCQVAQETTQNSRELKSLSSEMVQKIERAKRELYKLGVERARVLDQMTYINSVA